MDNTKENMHRTISNAFDASFEQLLEIEKNDKKRIPEELFKNVFLGLFANFENQHPHATIVNWISIAGSPFNYVDVVANNKIIFTVPPIFSKDAINPLAMDKNESISHIIGIAEKLSLRSGIESRNYIDNKLANTSLNIKSNVSKLQYAKEWNIIFRYYNLPELVDLPDSVKTNDKTPNDIKEDLRRDDLDFTLI